MSKEQDPGFPTTDDNEENKKSLTQPLTENPNTRFITTRRTHYNSMSHAGVNGLTLASPIGVSGVGTGLANRAPYGKNSRKSRNGFRHGTRKASDKEVWEYACDEMDELELDPNDPDYDSEENSESQEKVKPIFDDNEFEKRVTNIIRDYYDHCNVNDAIEALQGISMTPSQRRRLPVIAINLALQYKVGHCELTSELLSEMCGKLISMPGMQQSFRLLLDDMSDIVIDVPKAPDYIGRFIARAVADDILPPKFVQNVKELNDFMPPAGTSPVVSDTVHPPVRIASSRHNSASISESAGATRSSSGVSSCDPNMVSPSGDEPNYALQAINIAESLLTSNHAYRHLDIVWGLSPSERVTTMLQKQIYSTIIQYCSNDDFDAVLRSLNDLDSPHFLHEVVYQALIIAVQFNEREDVVSKLLDLLDKLCRAVVISYDQLVTGVKRVYTELPTLRKEYPIIYVVLDRYLRRAVDMGFMPKKLAQEMPKNPRKRFVSEGDGIRKSNRAIERV